MTKYDQYNLQNMNFGIISIYELNVNEKPTNYNVANNCKLNVKHIQKPTYVSVQWKIKLDIDITVYEKQKDLTKILLIFETEK